MVYSNNRDRRSSWSNCKPVYSFNTINISNVSVLRSPSIDLQYLQRLRFYEIVKSSEFSLEVVNTFENLVELELYFGDKDWPEEDQVTLKLNNLHCLYIQFGAKIFIEFDTPKLKTVLFDYEPLDDLIDLVDQPLETIRFASPSTVKNFNAFGLTQDQLPSDFDEVENFQYDELATLDLGHLLKQFPALNKLHISADLDDFEENALHQIVRQRAQLRPSLKISFQGFDISGSKTIGSYGFDRYDSLALRFRNSSSLLLRFNQPDLDYSELLSLTKDGGYPTDFFEEGLFRCVQSISVNDKIADPNRFLNFLSHCINLTSLELIDSCLDQETLDKLPSFTSLLNLEIWSDRDLQLNFKFVLRMTNLVEFQTNQNLCVELVRELVQKLKFLYWFVFKINDQVFSIDSGETNKDQYDLSEYDGEDDLFEEIVCSGTFENLIEYLQAKKLSELTSDLNNLSVQ